MKRLILILLCLPLFLFSQEERKYEKKISFSQFAKELKQATDKGESYIIEDYHITYDSIKDQKYVTIIEGFIGWFLLSIFLVSVLSQMMSV